MVGGGLATRVDPRLDPQPRPVRRAHVRPLRWWSGQCPLHIRDARPPTFIRKFLTNAADSCRARRGDQKIREVTVPRRGGGTRDVFAIDRADRSWPSPSLAAPVKSGGCFFCASGGSG